jgi:hypothetical protein
MSIAVPIILAVSLAVSLYGQAGWNWPNYQNEQNDKSDEDSSKDKSGKDEGSSSEKGKSGQKKNVYGKASAAASKGRRDPAQRRQE